MQKKVFTSSKLEEIKKRKNKIFKIKLFIFFILFILFIIGLSFLSKWQKLNIETIQIEGNKVLDKEDLEILVKNELNKKYIWLFPKSNIIILPKNKIKKDLLNQFGRIETINFNLNNFNTLEIKITEREALYTWCGEVLPEITLPKEQENCKFVDLNGFVFDKAPFFSGNVYFRFYGTLENSIYKENNFIQYVDFIEKIKILGLVPVALFEKEDGETEIYLSLNVPLKDAPKIIFNNKEDYDILFENLKIGVDTSPLKNNLKDNYINLSYIDLRFNNKVFYKFKE